MILNTNKTKPSCLYKKFKKLPISKKANVVTKLNETNPLKRTALGKSRSLFKLFKPYA